MIFGRKSRARTCPLCQREKKTAITEQLSIGAPCGPDECKFKADILAVLQIVEFHPAKQTGEPGKDLDSILEKLEASANSVNETKRRRELSSPEDEYVEDDLGRKYRRKKNQKRILSILFSLAILVIMIWFITKCGSDTTSEQLPKKSVPSRYQIKPQKSETIPVTLTTHSKPVTSSKQAEDEMNALLDRNDPTEDSTTNKLIGTWKGKILNDSISIFITGVTSSKLYGFVKRNDRSIPLEGSVWHSGDIWVVSLLEPGTNQQDGEYDLKWRSESGSIEGEWKAYNRRSKAEILLRK